MSTHSPVIPDSSLAPEVSPVVRDATVARRYGRKGFYSATLLGLFLVSAEITARLDDWLYRDVPLLATPDKDRDLFVWDGGILWGRPHGRFEKWRLNEFGFRGPEIQLTPAAGYTRVMVLGASESFGLYESENKEFPAQLAHLLDRLGSYEVVNAAVPGLTLRTMTPYWERWAAQFRPDIVVVYPSPLFYLVNNWPRQKAPRTAQEKAPRMEIQSEKAPTLRPRLLSHMKNVFHVPDFIQQWRNQRNIEANTAGMAPDWFFQVVPQDRLDFFAADLEELTASIRKCGAQPILLTHAIRSAAPPRPEDSADLHAMRVQLPRATAEVMPEFECAANRQVVDLGAKCDVPVINVAEVMNGRREWFADLVHFTDEGASVIAGLVADRIVTIPPSDNQVRSASR